MPSTILAISSSCKELTFLGCVMHRNYRDFKSPPKDSKITFGGDLTFHLEDEMVPWDGRNDGS